MMLASIAADIEALGFIQGGMMLASIAADRDHTLALWATGKEGWFNYRKREQAPLVTCSAYKGGGVHGFVSAPGGPDKPPKFVTYGAAHVKFWQSDRVSPTLDGRRGAFCGQGAPRIVVAAAYTSREKLVVGGSDGEIFFFEGNRAVRRVQPQLVPAALFLPLPDAVLTVYSNGIFCLLQTNDSEKQSPKAVEIDVSSLPGAPDPRLQSQFVGGATWKRSNMLLASRTFLLNIDLSGGLHQPKSCSVVLMQPSKPIAAACAHPSEPRIFTGALDGGVRCYRSDTQRPLPERSLQASAGVTCLAISGGAPPRGCSAWLAVGCEDASLSILGEAPYRYVLRRCLSPSRSRLTCAAFSSCDPSEKHPLWLAVGAEDGCIHTFRFKRPFCESSVHSGSEVVEKFAVLRGHSASVVDISFADTTPCTYLLSVDASGQSLVFDVPLSRRMQSSTGIVDDDDFSPWTAPLGRPVSGCWTPEQQQGPGGALPMRRFREVPGRQVVVASDAASPSLEVFPFPCPMPPTEQPPRLVGPAVPVTSVLHSLYSDCVCATSDTVTFVWSWSSSSGHLEEPTGPLQPLQGSVLLNTPSGAKRAVSAGSPTFTPPPRSNAPPGRRLGQRAKEEIGAVQPPNVHSHEAACASTPPRKASAREAWPSLGVPSPPSTPEKEAELAHEARPGPLFGGREDVAPTLDDGKMSPMRASGGGPSPQLASPPNRWQPPYPGGALPPGGGGSGGGGDVPWSLKRPAGLPEREEPQQLRRPKLKRSQSAVSPKVGAVGEGAAFTRLIREDTQARARDIHQRQQRDSVASLIAGQAPPSSVTWVVPAGTFGEAQAGLFLCRSLDEGSRCDVEVQLPRGRLAHVHRNPYRRSLTFEGETDGRPARLVVQVPVGFDLSVPPVCFAEWLRQRDQSEMVLTDKDFMKNALFSAAEMASKVVHAGPVQHVLGSPKTDAYGQQMDGPVQVQVKPRPVKKTIDHDEILVRMLAVPVDDSMVYAELGKGGVCLGMTGVGRIEQVGSRIEQYKQEDTVLVLPKPTKFHSQRPIGTARTLLICQEEDVLRIPSEVLEELTPEQICLTPSIVCAYTLLETYSAKLKPGDSVLLNAAHTSSIGVSLLQLCKLLKLKPLCILELPGAPKNRVKGEYGSKSAWQEVDDNVIAPPSVRTQYERISEWLLTMGAEEVFPDAIALLRWRDRHQRMLPKLALDGEAKAFSTEQLIHCLQPGDKDAQVVVYGYGVARPIEVAPPLLAAWSGTLLGFSLARWVHQMSANSKKLMAVMENITKLIRANKFTLDTVLYKVGEDAISDAFARCIDASDSAQVVLIFPTLAEELQNEGDGR